MSHFFGISNLFFILQPHRLAWKRTLYTSAWSYYHKMISEFSLNKTISIIFSLFFGFFSLSLFMKIPTAMIQIFLLTFFCHDCNLSMISPYLWNFTLTKRKAILTFYWNIFDVLSKEVKFGNILHRFLLPFDFCLVVKHFPNNSRKMLPPLNQQKL